MNVSVTETILFSSDCESGVTDGTSLPDVSVSGIVVKKSEILRQKAKPSLICS